MVLVGELQHRGQGGRPVLQAEQLREHVEKGGLGGNRALGAEGRLEETGFLPFQSSGGGRALRAAPGFVFGPAGRRPQAALDDLGDVLGAQVDAALGQRGGVDRPVPRPPFDGADLGFQVIVGIQIGDVLEIAFPKEGDDVGLFRGQKRDLPEEAQQLEELRLGQSPFEGQGAQAVLEQQVGQALEQIRLGVDDLAREQKRRFLDRELELPLGFEDGLQLGPGFGPGRGDRGVFRGIDLQTAGPRPAMAIRNSLTLASVSGETSPGAFRKAGGIAAAGFSGMPLSCEFPPLK